MTNNSHIRQANLTDIDGIRAVGVAAWYDTYAKFLPTAYIEWALAKWWTPETLARYITSDQFIVLVVEQDDEIVGMAHAQLKPNNTAILWRLYVARPHRSHGLGTHLLKEIEARLPAGTRALFIEHYQQNKRAAAFYAVHGYKFDRLETTAFEGTEIVSIFVKQYFRKRGITNSKGKK